MHTKAGLVKNTQKLLQFIYSVRRLIIVHSIMLNDRKVHVQTAQKRIKPKLGNLNQANKIP